MSEGKGTVKAVGGAAGIGAIALMRVLSGGADDAARVGVRAASELSAVGHVGEAAAHAGAGADDLARVGTSVIDDEARVAVGTADSLLDDGTHVGSDLAHDSPLGVGDALDVADFTLDVVDLPDGPQDEQGARGVWIGEAPNYRALENTVAAHPNTTIGFVVRIVRTTLMVGTDPSNLERIGATCEKSGSQCWVYLLSRDESQAAAIASWQASEDVPVGVAPGGVRVLGLR